MNYSSDIEVYRVMVGVGLGLVSMLRTINGIRSIVLYMVLWPMILVYLRWATKILSAFKLNEGMKKGFVLIFLMCTMIFRWHLLYVMGVAIVSGLLSLVGLGVYVYVIISTRLSVVLLGYFINLSFVNIGYKVLVLRLLPLPVFFVKVCGGILLLYYVLIFSYCNFLI